MRYALIICLALPTAVRGQVVLEAERPMSPPAWVMLERELLRANADACALFFDRYFDERGYLRCVERWGGDDGPDDAIESCNDWPLLHALGGRDRVLQMYKKAWEGHLRQYTEAKTTKVPFARAGMYFKQFPVMFDWLHNGEGLTVFNLQGLSDPDDAAFGKRVRRYAGFYMNEDPGAPNYDAEHKIIRSLFNGSRGPLMRKATGLDWAGDPIEIKNRFKPRHGETSYDQMLAHFKDYNDIVGDHPLNLLATSLPLNAYLLTGDKKYRGWLLDYVNAWRQRMLDNGDIIPTNIGLDGKIGSAAAGKWYGGVYGWSFTVTVPQDGSKAHRNIHHKGFTGFMNAYLLTGDDRFLEPWRKQIDKVNAQAKTIDGKKMYPRMFGDQGWYHFVPRKYDFNAVEIYYLSMDPKDRARIVDHLDIKEMYQGPQQSAQVLGWLRYLEGKNADYPLVALRQDLARIRQKVADIRKDETTPDTRLADDPMYLNPASVGSLVHLMLGGIHPGHQGSVLHARLRYFDPAQRRAGVPEDVAALVEKMDADSVTVTLVNTNQVEPRTLVVQAGGYAEHQFVEVSDGKNSTKVNASQFTVKLAPGCGQRYHIKMKRYVRQPTVSFPWARPGPRAAER